MHLWRISWLIPTMTFPASVTDTFERPSLARFPSEIYSTYKRSWPHRVTARCIWKENSQQNIWLHDNYWTASNIEPVLKAMSRVSHRSTFVPRFHCCPNTGRKLLPRYNLCIWRTICDYFEWQILYCNDWLIQMVIGFKRWTCKVD